MNNLVEEMMMMMMMKSLKPSRVNSWNDVYNARVHRKSVQGGRRVGLNRIVMQASCVIAVYSTSTRDSEISSSQKIHDLGFQSLRQLHRSVPLHLGDSSRENVTFATSHLSCSDKD